MENSLVLGHLPDKLSYHTALSFIRGLDEAPKISRLADALCAAGFSPRLAWSKLTSARRKAEVTWEALSSQGRKVHAVDFWSAHYPPALKYLAEPPWVLYFSGNLPRHAPIPTLAVVGSRRPTPYGAEIVADILPGLRTRPLQLVSGLAYGIDSLAHRWACECGIPNFAVLGSGPDTIYPPEHDRLAARILEGGGGWISELPPGTPPLRIHFPWRNRIIAGLADVAWIVQGTAKSGSLHTAKHALEQGKTVAATPGDIFNELSELPNRLLFEGAQIIVQAKDLDGLLTSVNHAVWASPQHPV